MKASNLHAAPGIPLCLGAWKGDGCTRRCIPAIRTAAACQVNRGFTLVEMLVVVGIIAVLLALIVPAISSLNSNGDVTSATYQVSSLLQLARSYATANDTYVWVGFYEEDASRASATPAVAGHGRIIIATVASADGTMVYNPSSPAALPSTSLIQTDKVTKINNMHLAAFAAGTGTGGTFDTRPPVSSVTCAGSSTPAEIGNISPGDSSASPPDTGTPFTVSQYTFTKVIEFDPRGEARINNTTYSLGTTLEIGLQQTHGNVVDAASKNVAIVQITGVAGNVSIYRR